MATIKELAQQYQAKQTHNISELMKVSVDLAILEGTGTDSTGKEFTYHYVEVDGNEYRIPDKVLSDLKAIMEKKPDLKYFSVTKSGQGLGTKYTTIPL